MSHSNNSTASVAATGPRLFNPDGLAEARALHTSFGSSRATASGRLARGPVISSRPTPSMMPKTQMPRSRPVTTYKGSMYPVRAATWVSQNAMPPAASLDFPSSAVQKRPAARSANVIPQYESSPSRHTRLRSDQSEPETVPKSSTANQATSSSNATHLTSGNESVGNMPIGLCHSMWAPRDNLAVTTLAAIDVGPAVTEPSLGAIFVPPPIDTTAPALSNTSSANPTTEKVTGTTTVSTGQETKPIVSQAMNPIVQSTTEPMTEPIAETVSTGATMGAQLEAELGNALSGLSEDSVQIVRPTEVLLRAILGLADRVNTLEEHHRPFKIKAKVLSVNREGTVFVCGSMEVAHVVRRVGQLSGDGGLNQILLNGRLLRMSDSVAEAGLKEDDVVEVKTV